MRVLRWLLGLLLVLVLAIGAAVLAARFRDGPTGALPGGPLRAGRARGRAAAGLGASRPTRTRDRAPARVADDVAHTWIVVKDGAAYVPCSLDFPPLKTLVQERSPQDGRAIVRVAGPPLPGDAS